MGLEMFFNKSSRAAAVTFILGAYPGVGGTKVGKKGSSEGAPASKAEGTETGDLT